MSRESLKSHVFLSQILTPKRVYFGVLVCVLICCLSIAAPPFLLNGNAGSRTLAGLIMLFYAPTCHQMADRSFHIGGHAMAVCTRCTGIYTGFLLGCLVYPAIRRLRSGWHPRKALLLAVTPMLVDFTVTRAGIYPSTLLIRAATGLVAGGICSVLLLPMILDIFDDNHK